MMVWHWPNCTIWDCFRHQLANLLSIMPLTLNRRLWAGRRDLQDNPCIHPNKVRDIRNRKQADRIAIILGEHGYRIAPLTDWRAPRLVFCEDEGADEVQSMARMEHELWCKVMLADGWQPGKVRSKKFKTNPDLVPWKKLPSDELNKNKKFIRDLPKVLARAGFQIERKESNY